MSTSGDTDVTRLLRDLTRELQTLQRELDADGQGRMPTRHQLSRFTSEVAIPSIILLLETNIRALQLLRRTIRLAEGREPQGTSGTAATEVRNRAEQLGQATLSRLDDTLSEVQSSLEEENANEEVKQLLDEAQHLQDQISKQLTTDVEAGEADGHEEPTSIGIDSEESEPVTIDVDEELRTLKDNLEDDDDDSQGDNHTDGDGPNGN